MSKIKYCSLPNYPTVELIGKSTSGSVFGTVARRDVGRRFLTEEAGFDPKSEEGRKMMVNGDEKILIQTVTKVAEKELFVKLAGDIKSAASFKFYDSFESANSENEGVTDLWVKGSCSETDEVVKCATGMCRLHPESSDRWEIVDKDGKRVFIRVFAGCNDNGDINE